MSDAILAAPTDNGVPVSLRSSRGLGWQGFGASLLEIRAGTYRIPAAEHHRSGSGASNAAGRSGSNGASAPVKGARFRGRNQRNATRWSRMCEVLDVEAPHRLAWRTLPTRLLPDSTRWAFELAPDRAAQG